MVALATLLVVLCYRLVHRHAMGLGQHGRAQRCRLAAIGCAALALTSLMSYQVLFSVLVIDPGVQIVPAGTDAVTGASLREELLRPPFVRPLWVEQRSSEPGALVPSLSEYLETFRGDGGWVSALEADYATLEHRVAGDHPLAREASKVLLVLIYVLMGLFIAGALGYGMPGRENALKH